MLPGTSLDSEAVVRSHRWSFLIGAESSKAFYILYINVLATMEVSLQYCMENVKSRIYDTKFLTASSHVSGRTQNEEYWSLIRWINELYLVWTDKLALWKNDKIIHLCLNLFTGSITCLCNLTLSSFQNSSCSVITDVCTGRYFSMRTVFKMYI